MLAPTGNIDQVYKALQRSQLRKIKRDATREINNVVSVTAKLEAEIEDGAVGRWYIVHTSPGNDMRTLRWLARRRFGAFMPTCAREDWGADRTLPGLLLVYVSDITKMRARIHALPGVTGMLCDPVTGQPVAVPDDDIARMRHQSFEPRDRPIRHAPEVNPQQPAPVRRPRKSERKALDRLKKEMKTKGRSYNDQQWAVINALDPRLRIFVLQRTLTLCPDDG